jgi:uncharacterized protein HemY
MIVLLPVLVLLVVYAVVVVFLIPRLPSRRRREREVREYWRARTATLEGAGSHLSTRPDYQSMYDPTLTDG